MNDVEVHMELEGVPYRVGLLRNRARINRPVIIFEYDHQWLESPFRFGLEPALPLHPGVFPPASNKPVYGSIGDAAPDSWGRELLKHREHELAKREQRKPRSLGEMDFLMGASDVSRTGALRFRWAGNKEFESPTESGVPQVNDLSKLRGEIAKYLSGDTQGYLELLVGAGSSLGGARPKAAFQGKDGNLMMAKFPTNKDRYSIESWEEVAMRLASLAKIEVPAHKLVSVAGSEVFLSRRFDRLGRSRLPYLSAMSMVGSADGEHGSYLEIAESLQMHGAQSPADLEQLFRRVAFNVLISNTDDHMRNHGFLLVGQHGWKLSPAFDLNPTPTDVKPRILTTYITLDDGTCSIELVLDTASYYRLSPGHSRAIVRDVAQATSKWHEVAKKMKRPKIEIDLMATAFEHDDLREALAA